MNEKNIDSATNPAFWAREASEPARRLLVLIHGWTGDEHSMTVFANKLPKDYWLYSPRGPVHADSTGFGWVDSSGEPQPDYLAYRSAALDLFVNLQKWVQSNRLTGLPIGVAGFSQGAAMAYTLALENPNVFNRVAGLAGYLPRGTEIAFADKLNALSGSRFFVAHGSQDKTVPVERARAAVDFLEHHGADVQYCEDNSAHKLSLSCFQAMGRFFDSA